MKAQDAIAKLEGIKCGPRPTSCPDQLALALREALEKANTPVARQDYRVGVPKKKQYRLILNSDAEEFGGSGKEQPLVYRAVSQECDGREYSFAYDLPAYGVAVFKF